MTEDHKVRGSIPRGGTFLYSSLFDFFNISIINPLYYDKSKLSISTFDVYCFEFERNYHKLMEFNDERTKNIEV